MKPGHRYRIVTNNPLVRDCLSGWYEIDYREVTFREILVIVRDLVHMGHELYTHPIAGSVKPNETPYKSIVVSKKPKKMEAMEAAIISDSIVTFDKFTPIKRELPERVLKDFRLIDYTLLCGAVGLDAVAGLNSKNNF